MREISLITGQLHRAIYNLNEEARRAANQKFESGLLSAPERSLRKAFNQFRDSLEQGDSQVRRRTASLLVTLVRSFEAIPEVLRPEILQMIDSGLADAEPEVREATVESYSMLLEKIVPERLDDRGGEGEGEGDGDDGGRSDDPAVDSLNRILSIAISDPVEIVREAAAVAVAVQKSEAVQQFGVQFLLDHVNDHRYRHACRSIESLAEFPGQQSQYLKTLNDCLNSGNWRFRRGALKAALRLAKLGELPQSLLINVVRRLFDGKAKVAAAAVEVVKTASGVIGRKNAAVGEFLTEVLWLCQQADPQQHLMAIIETGLAQKHDAEVAKMLRDRLAFHAANKAKGLDAGAVSESSSDFVALAGDLVRLRGRSGVGWIAGGILHAAS